MNRPSLWRHLVTVNRDHLWPHASQLPNNIILGQIEISFCFQHSRMIISCCSVSCATTCNISYHCEMFWWYQFFSYFLSHTLILQFTNHFFSCKVFQIICSLKLHLKSLLVEANFFNTVFHSCSPVSHTFNVFLIKFTYAISYQDGIRFGNWYKPFSQILSF